MASSLRDVKGRMRSLFALDRVAASAGLFPDGLLGEERRKTGWMRAEAARDRRARSLACQVGVFAAYVSFHEHAFVDRVTCP